MQILDAIKSGTTVEELENLWCDWLSRCQTGRVVADRKDVYTVLLQLLTRVCEMESASQAEGAYLFLFGLAEWTKQECDASGDWEILATLVEGLEPLLRTADERLRDVILHGFLEHLFEAPDARPFFRHWADDQQLAPLHREASDWGVENQGGFTAPDAGYAPPPLIMGPHTTRHRRSPVFVEKFGDAFLSTCGCVCPSDDRGPFAIRAYYAFLIGDLVWSDPKLAERLGANRGSFAGYEVVQVIDWEHQSFGCSPLFCNLMGKDVATNEYGLLANLEQVRALIPVMEDPSQPAEPGPYAIAAIHVWGGLGQG